MPLCAAPPCFYNQGITGRIELHTVGTADMASGNAYYEIGDGTPGAPIQQFYFNLVHNNPPTTPPPPTLTPSSAKGDTTLTCTPSGSTDPDGDSIKYLVKFYRGTSYIGLSTADRFYNYDCTSNMCQVGTQITCKSIAVDEHNIASTPSQSSNSILIKECTSGTCCDLSTNNFKTVGTTCGTLSCSDNYYKSGTESPTTTNYCHKQDKADSCTKQCTGSSTSCPTCTCTILSDSVTQSAGICKKITGCTGTTSGTVTNYPEGTGCGTNKKCDSNGNGNACECTSGTCCDGCNYKAQGTSCSTNKECTTDHQCRVTKPHFRQQVKSWIKDLFLLSELKSLLRS